MGLYLALRLAGSAPVGARQDQDQDAPGSGRGVDLAGLVIVL